MPASQTRAEILSDAIANAILSGDFAPGTHLDEQILAKRFGVSRTPVRDALRLLNGTGLIDLRPRVGATVRTITADELDRLFIAMGEVEASCARLATLSMTSAERDRLRSLHERMGLMAQAQAREAYVVANQDFHGLLYEGAQNAVIEEIARNLRRRLTPYRKAQFQAPGRLARSHAEHGLVVRAVLARDAAAANAAMLVHMSVVEDAFETFDADGAADRAAAGERARDRRRGGAPARQAAVAGPARPRR
ncbi:GntR family transcriptional regulator [uncultured Methylobacterium sp.]|uniref:GntR family transcriptional regulator n=1 Tax=uncultured Methylobacterium sp. TaxID=157278 RepID=UPI0035CC1392